MKIDKGTRANLCVSSYSALSKKLRSQGTQRCLHLKSKRRGTTLESRTHARACTKVNVAITLRAIKGTSSAKRSASGWHEGVSADI